jgi:hypothetical protein
MLTIVRSLSGWIMDPDTQTNSDPRPGVGPVRTTRVAADLKATFTMKEEKANFVRASAAHGCVPSSAIKFDLRDEIERIRALAALA